MPGKKLGAACGASAPVVFSIILAIAGLLQPGYNQITQQISELGYTGAANPALQNGNFIVTGLLIIAFDIGLKGAHTGIRSQGWGSSFVMIAGLGFVGAGFFPGNYDSYTGAVHGLFVFVTFISLILAPLLIARKLGSEQNWNRLKPYFRATGIAVAVLFVAYLPFGSQEVLSPWRGAFQRTLFVTPFCGSRSLQSSFSGSHPSLDAPRPFH